MNTSCVGNCIFYCVYRGKRYLIWQYVFNFWGKTVFFCFSGIGAGNKWGGSFFCVFIFSLHKLSKPIDLVIFDLNCTRVIDKSYSVWVVVKTDSWVFTVWVKSGWLWCTAVNKHGKKKKKKLSSHLQTTPETFRIHDLSNKWRDF